MSGPNLSNNPMKKWVICFVIFSCLGCSGDQQQVKSYQMQIDSLNATLKDTEFQIDSLQKVVDAKPLDNPWFHASIEGRALQQKGIDDPEGYIEKSLREKPELIPLKPVLGGTMRFVNVQVLGRHWVIAEYEDGHILGRTIYEYTIDQDGDVLFKELVSTNKGN